MGDPAIRPYRFSSPPAALWPWNPSVPLAAHSVISLIIERLPDTTVAHVGSTAVPGCAGKEYLDFVIP